MAQRGPRKRPIKFFYATQTGVGAADLHAVLHRARVGAADLPPLPREPPPRALRPRGRARAAPRLRARTRKAKGYRATGVAALIHSCARAGGPRSGTRGARWRAEPITISPIDARLRERPRSGEPLGGREPRRLPADVGRHPGADGSGRRSRAGGASAASCARAEAVAEVRDGLPPGDGSAARRRKLHRARERRDRAQGARGVRGELREGRRGPPGHGGAPSRPGSRPETCRRSSGRRTRRSRPGSGRWRRRRRRAPLRGLALERLATGYESKGAFAEAAAAHEEAASIPAFPLRHYAMADAARCFAAAGERDRAVALADRVLSEAPDLPLPDHVRSRLDELHTR